MEVLLKHGLDVHEREDLKLLAIIWKMHDEIEEDVWPNHTLLVKPKYPTLEMSQNDVIYRIHCRNCSKTYVGQSKTSLQQRLKEHE